MPTSQQHLAAFASNKRLSLILERNGHLDWAITTMFYAALHLSDAFPATQAIHPRSHLQRNRYFRQYPQLYAMWPEYNELEDRSRDARYNCVVFSPVAVQRLRRINFEPLNQHLRTLLGI